jgi:hypothetical protein
MHKPTPPEAAASLDLKQLLFDLRSLETKLSDIQHRVVTALGGPAVIPSLFQETESNSISLSVEVMDESAVIVDDPNITPSPEVVPIENFTGQEVSVTIGPPRPGVIAITIPDGQTRGLKRVPGKSLQTEFVMYETFDPCADGAVIGVLCIIQVYRHVIRKAGDARPGDPLHDGVPMAGRIRLEKQPSGGFSLRT